MQKDSSHLALLPPTSSPPKSNRHWPILGLCKPGSTAFRFLNMQEYDLFSCVHEFF